MSVYTVTGLMYGDEGKGGTVDFLARQGTSLVVRHNGGPQAGHNVITPEGRHHEFSQWGSGHFAGADTYLSKHMLINPGDMRLEAVGLQFPGDPDPWKSLHIDMECRIITPFHVALQRLFAYAKGESCGRGVGEAMRQDIERPDLTIRVRDVMFTNLAMVSLTKKLADLREYLRKYAYRIGWSLARSGPDWALLHDVSLAATLAEDYHDWRALGWYVADEEWLASQRQHFEHLIFEGAQGVLLDEWHGFHPYTTWSTTTDANALSILQDIGYDGPVQRLGVTRAYLTRHGAGPFVTEDASLAYDEPHNTTGTYQGKFRQGHCDMVALRYAIEACGGIDGLVVTHLDRADSWRVAERYVRSGIGRRSLVFLPEHDLEHQAMLTEDLFETRPQYLESKIDGRIDTEGLLAMLSSLAPIVIESYGPTADDKTWTDQVVPARIVL